MSEALSLEAIISQLDAPYNGTLPRVALREAQRRGTEMVPDLIDLIKKATAASRTGEVPTRNGHLFALYLLTEFRAKEALASIVEAISLPGEGPFDLFGDTITEDLSRILAVLAADQSEMIDALIADQSINEYVRWQAIRTFRHWVRDGHWTREEAVQRLRYHLSTATQQEDYKITTELVGELAKYSPRECQDEIEEVFRLGLVDQYEVSSSSVARSIEKGESWFQQELQDLPPTGIQDTVADLERWACFQESDRPAKAPRLHQTPTTFQEDDWNDGPEDENLWSSGTTIHHGTVRVGRNEPCPCGSGKKYKKCCGRETS
jgi:hypothetical protein